MASNSTRIAPLLGTWSGPFHTFSDPTVLGTVTLTIVPSPENEDRTATISGTLTTNDYGSAKVSGKIDLNTHPTTLMDITFSNPGNGVIVGGKTSVSVNGHLVVTRDPEEAIGGDSVVDWTMDLTHASAAVPLRP